MTRILRRRDIIPGQTVEMVLHAPAIAAAARPGHFVILRVHPMGERIPLTIADADAAAGTITIVFLVVGTTTARLAQLSEGEDILDVCGPLGQATHLTRVGKVVCVGGGTGIAAMHHIAKGHAQVGNQVTAVIGARSADLLLFEEELGRFCHEVLVATNDGSRGVRGLVTDALRQHFAAHPDVAEVVAVGPVPMMRAVAELTRPLGIKTVVSLNSIMVDGMGMCGACRVRVGGEIRFACVDGPEFDGHAVDFDELAARLTAFVSQERQSFGCLGACHG
ncbi:MAG: ferredoxin/flavodoxin---NADP+ reductase [Desulfomicrobiaceae bacterium]|jgi:ferredoxin--NADP+ reductase|nr:sulfide/dihydroorotate dehydrogenase-like FAD/NAD-binding protein [Desulfomicrobiaceae bacterium]MDI3492740.1 ferredoxin/flavodoxin---NADP+ reductase [Desulfomicrobiaceae bacterium]MDK2873637.1 ferredoxin/flavodoxin---NADP+ reductase [Desulfomicrobiaceae bacterium]HCF04643.1 sulfide/dihydroorotate dehydrogenase-like FAD/NAD-binding protein [Desulfomicrobiaceae bacterium]